MEFIAADAEARRALGRCEFLIGLPYNTILYPLPCTVRIIFGWAAFASIF